ncbi:MAG: PKD domain-containing protein, partial [Bacteroidia bacterium]
LASGGTGSYTYTWLPYGSNASIADSLSADTYTVTVTDQNTCNASISIIIEEPTPLSSSIDSLVHPICYNGFGSATAFASNGTAPYSYLWQPIADTNSFANNIQAGTYTVVVTDANGCISTSTTTINQPTQVTTLVSANDTVCLGQSSLLSATATGGAGNYYYAWQPSGAINSGSITITPTSDVTYTVVAFDGLGCSGTSNTISTIVYTLNDTSINAFATSPVCPGQDAVVYAESYGNTGNLTYQWSGGLGNQAGVYTVNPVTPSQYIVTVSNTCASVSDTVNILINPPPIVNFVSNTNALCVPGTVQFADSSVSGYSNDPITSWTWNFGDGSASNDQNPSHNYTSASSFPVSLTVTTSGGCTNNNSLSPQTINGYPYPTAAFSLNATELNLPYDVMQCINQSQGATSYVWNFGDGVSSTQDSPNYLYSSIGIFNVELIATTINGCSDTAYSMVTTNADIVFPSAFTPNVDASSGGEYDINSLTNDVFFPYTAGVVEYNLEIFNRWGEKIFESNDVKKGWDGYYNGKICQQDVYIWRAFLKLNNGKEYEKNGNLTLIY